MTIKELKCPNCGGAVDREDLICHYCGTQFVRKDDTPVFRVEHCSSPVRILEKGVRISREQLVYAPESVELCAKKDIAKRLADSLIEGNMVEFISEMDWRTCEQIISGRLRVLERGYRF